jgi:hypothetical protein
MTKILIKSGCRRRSAAMRTPVESANSSPAGGSSSGWHPQTNLNAATTVTLGGLVNPTGRELRAGRLVGHRALFTIN